MNIGNKKMKTEILTLIEIAIVLCLTLLVALPVIADAQNIQTERVSVLTAPEDDFVLGIYGNANEDDTIDMRDLTYVKLIFFGERQETVLADAKYDAEINPLDFVQIKLIIVGKEKELTLLQYLGYPPDLIEKPVTVPMPIERVVTLSNYAAEAVCTFGAQDRIVGVTDGAKKKEREIKTLVRDKPSVGKGHDLGHGGFDLEKVLELRPDIVLTYSYRYYPDTDESFDDAGIPLVHMDFHQPEKHSREISNLGWLLNNKDRAEELIDFEQQHISLIKERVKDMEPEERTRAYYCLGVGYYGDPTHTAGSGTSKQNDIVLCGGINTFADVESYVAVDPEEIIVRNPQVIFASASGVLGYGISDTSSVEEIRNESIMNYPGFDHIDAVKDGRVYFVSTGTSSTHHSVWLSYMAKYFYPELFEDVDPVAIHKEWLETFLGIEYEGVYAYPTPWIEGS